MVLLVDINEQVRNHAEQLHKHDLEIKRINENINIMQSDIKEGLTRVDESNRFLREQNERQSMQNERILSAVIGTNQEQTKLEHEKEMTKLAYIFDIVMKVVVSGGAIYMIIEWLLSR